MQNLNGLRAESLDLPKRSRFYQSTMDVDFLSKGDTYRELVESNVIFICTFDPFGAGYARYTFEYLCNENPDIKLEDKTYKWFYNCMCDLNKVPDEMRSLYRYIQSGEADSRLTEKLHTAVVSARRNEIWRSEYMKELLIYQDMKEEGREEGREEVREEGRTQLLIDQICRKFVKGRSVEQIADELGESLDDIIPIYEEVSKYATESGGIVGDGEVLYKRIIKNK